MTQASTQLPSNVTNFNFLSLHLLRHEINVAIKNTEINLNEFSDDKEQAYFLLDSIDMMGQLASILELLSLDGASDLANAIAKILQLLYDNADNSAEDIILAVSEAIITLERYIEFVLLKEMLAPSLLMPIINKLHQYLDMPVLKVADFINRKTCSISIFNVESNYQPLAELELDIDIKNLLSAYRTGLNVLLKCKTAIVSADDRKKLQTMQYACECISKKSDSLFWQAVTVAVTDIEKTLPLTEKDKHTLVFVEQVFLNTVSVNNKGFADLLSFACHRNNSLAQDIKQLYTKNSLSEEQLQLMRKYLFAPSHQVLETVNELIQAEINSIKKNVDILAKQEDTDGRVGIEQIVTALQTLSSSLQLLNLNDASQAMQQQAQIVSQWQAPSIKNIDELLVSLIIAENASINLLKQHSSGVINFPLQNKGISLYQLNQAYDIIIVHSHKNLTKIEQLITDYIKDNNQNKELLTPVVSLLHEITGALSFLKLTEEMRITLRLEKYLKQMIATDNLQQDSFKHIATIIMVINYQLTGLENSLTANKQVINIGHQSLNQLLVA